MYNEASHGYQANLEREISPNLPQAPGKVAPAQNPAPAQVQSTGGLSCVESVKDRVSLEDLGSTSNEVVQAYGEFRSYQAEELVLLDEKIQLHLERDEHIEAGDTKSKEYKDIILRLDSLESELIGLGKSFEQFEKDYIIGGAITIGPNKVRDVSLTTALGRMELAMLMSADCELRHPERLDSVIQYLDLATQETNSKERKKELLLSARQDLNAYVNSIPDYLKDNTAFKEIDYAFREYNISESLSLTEKLLKPLKDTDYYQEALAELEPFLRVFRNLPVEALEDVGFEVPRTSKIFDQDLSKYLTMSEDELSKLSLDEYRIANEARNMFWDINTPWQTPITADSDVNVIKTSYASLKRISELVSAFETKLLEINNQNVDATQKTELRSKATDKFWELYHDTSSLIKGEFLGQVVVFVNSQVENTSDFTVQLALLANSEDSETARSAKLMLSTLNDAYSQRKLNIDPTKLDLAKKILHGDPEAIKQVNDIVSPLSEDQANKIKNFTEPYQGLLDALAVVPLDGHLNLYSNNCFNSHQNTRLETINAINPAFNEISEFLANTKASPSEIANVFNSIRDSNKDHPEYDKLNSWINAFPKKFRRLYPD